MISFKVFDNNLVNSNKKYIDFINSREDVFLEYTYYNKDNSELLKNMETFKYKDSSFHLNSKEVNLIDFSQEKFLRELSLARCLNSRKLIIHPEKLDAPKRLSYQFYYIPEIVKKLKEITEYLDETETIYIENVRFELEFYQMLFLEIKEKNIKQVGFCFDIGHGKVFSQYSFEEWFFFLEWLDSEDIDIYFHIHANEGHKDEHKPFYSFKDISILNDGVYTNDVIKDLKRLFKKFSDKWFSLELMPEDVIKEIEFLEKKEIYNR